jgi:hypothetical protein
VPLNQRTVLQMSVLQTAAPQMMQLKRTVVRIAVLQEMLSLITVQLRMIVFQLVE